MSVVGSKEWRGILLHFFSKEIKVLIFDRVIVILSLFFYSLTILMKLFAEFLVLMVAIEHLYILYIEMFSWEQLGKKVFKWVLENNLFEKTKGLAKNIASRYLLHKKSGLV